MASRSIPGRCPSRLLRRQFSSTRRGSSLPCGECQCRWAPWYSVSIRVLRNGSVQSRARETSCGPRARLECRFECNTHYSTRSLDRGSCWEVHSRASFRQRQREDIAPSMVWPLGTVWLSTSTICVATTRPALSSGNARSNEGRLRACSSHGAQRTCEFPEQHTTCVKPRSYPSRVRPPSSPPYRRIQSRKPPSFDTRANPPQHCRPRKDESF